MTSSDKTKEAQGEKMQSPSATQHTDELSRRRPTLSLWLVGVVVLLVVTGAIVGLVNLYHSNSLPVNITPTPALLHSSSVVFRAKVVDARNGKIIKKAKIILVDQAVPINYGTNEKGEFRINLDRSIKWLESRYLQKGLIWLKKHTP